MNRIIQQIMKYNYLGIVTSSDKEVRTQANKTNEIAY